tara:strand:- start:756 stop:923 length:168 start_codon:yes stop_codon:yes gene_type:complete
MFACYVEVDKITVVELYAFAHKRRTTVMSKQRRPQCLQVSGAEPPGWFEFVRASV